MIHNQDSSTRTQSRKQVADDIARFFIWPVVQDEAEDIDVCDCGLGLEEVVFLEGDGFTVFGRKLGSGGCDNAGLVLDCGGYMWVGVYYCHAEVAFVASDLTSH